MEDKLVVYGIIGAVTLAVILLLALYWPKDANMEE